MAVYGLNVLIESKVQKTCVLTVAEWLVSEDWMSQNNSCFLNSDARSEHEHIKCRKSPLVLLANSIESGMTVF